MENILTRITSDELEKFRLNFSRCGNRDETPLKQFSNYAVQFGINI